MKELCFDISAWQGGINYQAIRERVNYCILRAGYSNTKDKCFEEHYANLQGLNLGAYWYSYALSVEGARQEARSFLNTIKGKRFTLPLYLDLEDASQAGLGRDTLNAMVRAFGEEIENAGYYFGVYTNLNWYRNIISGSELNSKYDWWIACWSDSAPSNVDYGVWQFTSDYNTFGCRLDANYVLKDYPKIIKELGLNHLDDEPTPTPTPVSGVVADYQRWLNANYGYNLVVDNIFGIDTKKHSIMALQNEFNWQLGSGLVVDGIFGPATKNACPNLVVGMSGNITKNVQYMLSIKGYSVGNYGIDGIYGEDTKNAVVNFQRDNGLVVDGICGANTFEKLFN